MPNTFQPFTPTHLAAVTVGLFAVLLLILAGRRGGVTAQRARLLLATLNFSIYPLSLVAWWTLGQQTSIDNYLPFHLCDIAAITAGFALLTRHPLLCSLTYFWGLAATLQGLITPAITVGFPSLPFFSFFIHHFAVVTAALYLPLADGWKPKHSIGKEVLRVYGCSLLYLVFAMAANSLLGSNFAFASRPPDNPSLIDQLGPWPWYLVAMQAVALVFFSLLALPFYRTQEKKHPQPVAEEIS